MAAFLSNKAIVMSYRNSIRRSLWLELHTFSLHPLVFLRRTWPAFVLEGVLWVVAVAFLLYSFIPEWAALPVTASSGLVVNLSTYLRGLSPVVYVGISVWWMALIAARSFSTVRIHSVHHDFGQQEEMADESQGSLAPRKYFMRMLGVSVLCSLLGTGVIAFVVIAVVHQLPLWTYPLCLPVIFLIGMLHTGLRLLTDCSERFTWPKLFHDFVHGVRWGAILIVNFLHGIVLGILGALLFLPLVPVIPAQLFDAMNEHAGELSGIPPVVCILCLLVVWLSGALFSACRLMLYRAALYLR